MVLGGGAGWLMASGGCLVSPAAVHSDEGGVVPLMLLAPPQHAITLQILQHLVWDCLAAASSADPSFPRGGRGLAAGGGVADAPALWSQTRAGGEAVGVQAVVVVGRSPLWRLRAAGQQQGALLLSRGAQSHGGHGHGQTGQGGHL